MRVQLRVERRRSSRKKSSCTLMLSSWTWQWLLKIILAVVMLIVTLVFGLLPIKVLEYLRKSAARLQRSNRNGTAPSDDYDISGGRRWPGLVLCLLSCFTGGVFLATSFLHLLPEVQERLDGMKAKFNWTTEYPYAELVSCLGFFLVYFVEEIVLSFLKGGQGGHSHSVNLGPKATNSAFTLDVAEPERCEANGKDTPMLMTTGPHKHSHEVRSITLVLTLSFHSVIEGIAFGIANTKEEVTALFLTLIVHKVIVSFAIGMQLARTHAHKIWLVLTTMCLFSAMAPLGTMIGILIEYEASDSMGKEIVILIFEGMAVGTFIYVTFFEVLIHERDNEYPNLVKLLVVMVGFSLIALLGLMAEPEHIPSTTTSTANYSTPLPALCH